MRRAAVKGWLYMGKYDPLHAYLVASSASDITIAFAELERIAGLPISAYRDRTWWGNTRNRGRVQAHAWLEAGWQVDSVNLADEWVRFIRISHGNA